MKRMCIVLAMLMASTAALADDDGVPRPGPTGLSVFANAGAVWADGVNANFYSGRPENANTINRVLYSESYGYNIWYQLKEDGLISSAVGSKDEILPELLKSTVPVVCNRILEGGVTHAD